jgi:DNA-binding PadR family transcriptional regulator
LEQVAGQLPGGERHRRRTPGALRTAVLAALVEAPGHGYDLTNRLKRRLGPLLPADSRRVYEALEQLEKERLIHPSEQREALSAHRPRRVFSATPSGHELHAAWLGEREQAALTHADVYALVAFSAPEHAPLLLAKLDECEADCIELQQEIDEVELDRGSWRSRMVNVTRAAVSERLQAELRWIARVRREIEEYSSEAR